jgi:hypothetical protein
MVLALRLLDPFRQFVGGSAYAVFLGVVLVLAAPAQASAPRDELLRLVPDDAGFCFVVQDLRAQAQALHQSPFADEVRQSAIGKAASNAPEFRKLLAVEKYFQDQFGINWPRLRDDILGDAVVLAYWPGPAGRPELEQGLVMIRTRDAQVLTGLIGTFLDVLKKTGISTPLESRKYNDVDYSLWNDGKRTTFFYARDAVAILSHHEDLLRRVIDLDRQPAGKGDRLVSRQLQRLGLDKALAALWINPRAFEPEMEQKAAEAAGIEGGVRKTLLTYWKALDGIALYAALHQADLEMGLAFLVEEARLPSPARQVLARKGQASELWRFFPQNALLTVAARIDSVRLTEMASTFLTEPARKAFREMVDRYASASLGSDVARDVVPCLGPDVGFCVLPPPAAEKQAWFPSLIGALRVQPGKQEPPLERTLLTAVNTLAVFVGVAYNSTHTDQMVLSSEMQDKVEVKFMTNARFFPSGVQPAFAFKDGYLVVASSPAAVQMFRVNAAPIPEAAGEIPWLRLSLHEVCRYLQGKREHFADQIAQKDGVSREEATRRLNDGLAFLGLFDRLEINHKRAPGQLTLLLRMRTNQPLQK